MATKQDLAAQLLSDLDDAAGDMASAAEAFKTAFIQANANDMARARLVNEWRGQRLDQNKLTTIDTQSHSSYRTAGVLLFDGASTQPAIEQAADGILAQLQSDHPEAFA